MYAIRSYYALPDTKSITVLFIAYGFTVYLEFNRVICVCRLDEIPAAVIFLVFKEELQYFRLCEVHFAVVFENAENLAFGHQKSSTVWSFLRLYCFFGI